MILEILLAIFLLYVLYTQHRMHQVPVESDTDSPDEPLSHEEVVFYQECKKYYDITGTPLISISDEIFSDHAAFISVSLKFGIDENYDTFNREEFLNRICNILNINTNDVRITKLQRGSMILEILIDGKEANIELVIHNMHVPPSEKEQEELAKLKVFFMFMGDINSLNDQQKFRSKISLDPQWNCVYDVDHTHWVGALQDEKDRGEHAYFCPSGWERHALHVCDNYDEKFKGWSICYHGTKFAYGLSILLSGLAPARIAALGQGIYASQSIVYVAHPRYAEIKRIKSSNENNFFTNGHYVQFVLQCRVHPRNITRIGSETLGVYGKTIIDPNLSNDVIEWVINAENKNLMDFNDPNSTIVCTGLMMRVTENHPGLLPESQWWYSGHVCNNKVCCCLGIDLNDLMEQRKKDATWKQFGITIAGGNGAGHELNQLSDPISVSIDDDDDQTIYITEAANHRIVGWKCDATTGQIVAGGKGKGDDTDQLDSPSYMIIDKENNSFIISDYKNSRVLRWPRQSNTNGQIIIEGVDCQGLAMDKDGSLYVSDHMGDEVRRWERGAEVGTVVAGGCGTGDHLSQLNGPLYLFIDDDYSLYVSDSKNHRVMKWIKGAKEGIIVAGGNGPGNSLTQLFHPRAMLVDRWGQIYVVDQSNHRVMRWSKGAKQGTIVVGGNGQGQELNQFDHPSGLSMDREGNLYVTDRRNHRVQKFEIN